MGRKQRQLISTVLASMILLTGCATDSGTNETDANNDKTQQEATQTDDKQDDKDEAKETPDGDPVVLTYAVINRDQKDPYYVDEITGEYIMDEEYREIFLQVIDEIREELNVELQFTPIPGKISEVLLQSVLAGDPIGDIVDIEINSQGYVLPQNVLQPLDDYVDLLGEYPHPKVYGHHYFLESGKSSDGFALSQLVYNIDYIEAVEALKVDGETVYPSDLYLDGNWTWSVFEDYLEAIEQHYANSQAPERPENRIEAFKTDYTEAINHAIHSNGGAIYGEHGLQIETPEVKEAVNYVEDLLEKGLMTTNVEPGTASAPWASQATDFTMGESVFTQMEDWRLGGAGDSAANRGQSIATIPFPRPDDMDLDDPLYRPAVTKGMSTVIPRGIDEEKIPLAIQTYNMFYERSAELKEELAIAKGEDVEAEYVRQLPGIDYFHEEVGVDTLEIYNDFKAPTNELSIMLGIYWPFMGIAGDAMFGVEGSPEFEIAFESSKASIVNQIAETEAILNTEELKDNIAPSVTKLDGNKIFAVAQGTDPATLDFTADFKSEDAIDGVLDMTAAEYDMSETDFNTVGEYKDGLVVKSKDTSDNEGKSKNYMIVYDANNTDAPVITVKEEYRNIKVDEDSSAINWKDFIESAVDADGLNVSASITPDLSSLDTTTAGEYEVPLTVTDFVGNTASVTVNVTVAAE